MNFENREKLSYSLLRIMTKLLKIDKRTRHYGTNKTLYEAEIHMIKAIKENKGIHVTGLAEILGVTKGAVSQIIMKLEKKGMIEKRADPENLSRLVLHLTHQGETAYIHHEKLHEEYEKIFSQVLEDSSEENRAFLKEFLIKLENAIDHFGD